jgi:ATP-dependent DNA ligase
VLRRAGRVGLSHPSPAAERGADVPLRFDLLELDGTDLSGEPIEVRKATLASILRKSRPGVRLNEHLEHDCVFQHACKMGLRNRLEATGIALPIWAFSRLVEVQES